MTSLFPSAHEAGDIESIDLNSEEGQGRLHRLFRYAQIGRCVSSVTHDVNNLLGAILAYAELIELDSDLTKESSRMVQEIVAAVRKSSGLVNNLTDVARKERRDVRLMEPSQLLDRVLDLRRYDLKVAQVTVKVECVPGLAPVQLDLPRTEQALVYLVSNAVEALQGQSRRILRVCARPVDGDLAIDVWNSGEPIAEDLHERVFEPYYTTKGDEHLGLGLTLARKTARAQGGDLTYHPDQGFVFRLPTQPGPGRGAA